MQKLLISFKITLVILKSCVAFLGELDLKGAYLRFTLHPPGMLAAVTSVGGAAEGGLESESLPLPRWLQGPVRGRVWSQGARAGALRVKRKRVCSL